ncbi:MAG: hypothetical protein AAGA32_22550 [Pseudomonadota bacterium]
MTPTASVGQDSFDRDLARDSHLNTLSPLGRTTLLAPRFVLRRCLLVRVGRAFDAGGLAGDVIGRHRYLASAATRATRRCLFG